METLRYDLVKIRKPHICHDCLRKFEPATMMYSWACVDSGQMNSGYTCQTCNELQYLCADDFPDGFDRGWVNESLSKGQTPEEYLVEVREYEKQRVKRLIEAKEREKKIFCNHLTE